MKIDAAMIQLDDLQLEEPDASSDRYLSLSNVKTDLRSAIDLVDGRLDLIEKVDASKVGWAAAAVYDKTNGPLKKAESDKNWADAEKAVTDSKRKDRSQPFRDGPVQAGKDAYYPRSSRGLPFLPFFYSRCADLSLSLCYLGLL